MTTALYRPGGTMFFDTSGKQLAGGQLFYYQAGTTNAAATYADAAGSILNPFPIALNVSGQLTVPVYFGSAYNYKELLTDANGATIATWPYDNLPSAPGAPQTQTGFERLYLPWVSLTSASSPVTIASGTAGNGFECDCTSGSITGNLPAASTSGLAGTGYFFKRIDSVLANSLSIVPNGSDTIDGINAPIGVGIGYAGVYIVSDGAQWLTYSFFNQSARQAGTSQVVTSSGGIQTIDLNNGWNVDLTINGNITGFIFTNIPAGFVKVVLNIINGGAYNITGWIGTTYWTGGVAPTITSGSGKKDTIILTSDDIFLNTRGYITAQNMS